MQCRTCGTALPAGAAFCPNCGTATPYTVSRQEGTHSAAISPPGTASAGILPPNIAPPANPYGAPPQSGSSQYPPHATPHPPSGPGPQTLSSTENSSGGSSSSLLRSEEKPGALEHSAARVHEHAHEHAPTDTPDAHEEHEENANERLILFSDGVIAFAITIAAISIKIPRDPAQLVQQQQSRVVAYIAYIVSFVIVAASWNEHHRLFHYIKRNDMLLVLLNFAYLAAIVLVPIGIFLVEDVDLNNPDNLLKAVLLFLGSQLGAGVALLLIWLYASRRHRLLDAEMNPRLITYTTIRMFSQPAVIGLLVFVLLVSFLPAGIVGLLLLVAALIYRRWYRRGLDISAGSNDVGRILLFSDAVIGIAITIIAAQIEFPSFGGSTAGEEVQTAIANNLHLVFSYAIGFVVLGVYWLFHYRMFRYINRHDPWLIVLNFGFLLCIVLMFAPINSYVAFYSQRPGARIYFGIWQTITALLLVLTWWRAAGKRRLLDYTISDDQIRRFGARVVSNLLIIFALMFVALSPAIHPGWYLLLYLAALGLATLVIHVRGRRAQAQQVRVA